jgi:hypothetical protein
LRAAIHRRSAHPETPSPCLCGESLYFFLPDSFAIDGILRALSSDVSVNLHSFSTTPQFHPTFQRISNGYSTVQCIVLPNPCRIITIQKPWKNKNITTWSLNSQESVTYPFPSANQCFEKYYRPASRAPRSTLSTPKSELPATHTPRYPLPSTSPSCRTEDSNAG